MKSLREKFDAEKKKSAQVFTDKIGSDSKARNMENELVKYRHEAMRLTQTVPTPSGTSQSFSSVRVSSPNLLLFISKPSSCPK